MKRFDCLKVIESFMTDEDIVVANVGNTSLEWHTIRPSPANLYNVNLGQCTPVGLGLALALPTRRVMAFDGDGNVLLNLASLADAAYLRPSNFRIIVFDNQAYESPGCLPTATAHGTDLEAIAKGAGIKKTLTIRSLEEFVNKIQLVFNEKEFCLVVAKIETGTVGTRPINMDGKRNKYQFATYIEDTEKKPVLRLRSQSPLVE
ncbi:MAG: sulfopyruvate decarboxylase subunit beta [Deltaproteobacteria bacterium]|nr:sulfopyruvate decarboxylase subunit beta [Deltaproteobacteria bacterium]